MSFLSVILDCNQFNWGTIIANHKESGLDVHKEIIRATISLCNSHLFSSLNNHLTLIAGGITQTSKKFVYEKNQNQEKQNFTESIEKFIYDILSKSISKDDSTSHYAGAISLSNCSFQKFKKQFPNSTGKIVIINLAKDLSREQNVLMNLFFASRQNSLKVDVASLNGSVPILQQASDITGGVHLLITDYKLLAQELLGNSFVDGQNPIFKRPSSDMDYRAVCHCHNKLISIGWVCSVCLSVTCNFVPFCKICNAIFPRPIPLYNQQKRPRKI